MSDIQDFYGILYAHRDGQSQLTSFNTSSLTSVSVRSERGSIGIGLTLIDVWTFSFSGVDLGLGVLLFAGDGVLSFSGAWTISSFPIDTSPSDRDDTLPSLGDSELSLEACLSSDTSWGGLGAWLLFGEGFAGFSRSRSGVFGLSGVADLWGSSVSIFSWSECSRIGYTVSFLCFRTDRSGQKVQTNIRLLLEEQSDQGLHCLQFPLHLLDALL